MSMGPESQGTQVPSRAIEEWAEVWWLRLGLIAVSDRMRAREQDERRPPETNQ